MKDFDKKRRERIARPVDDRSFVLGGETFVVRAAVRPDVLAMLDGIVDAKFEDTIENGKPVRKLVERGTPVGHDIAVMDNLVLELIEDTDDGHARWSAVRARTDDPILMEDISDVMLWAIGVASGRDGEDGRHPTGLPSASTDGRSPTGTPLTAVSSSPDSPVESTG